MDDNTKVCQVDKPPRVVESAGGLVVRMVSRCDTAGAPQQPHNAKLP